MSMGIIEIEIIILCIAFIRFEFQTAFEIFSESATNDLLTAEQKKLLQAATKKKREDEASAAWAAANKRSTPPYLSMALAGAGGKRFKRDRTNSPCHLCQ